MTRRLIALLVFAAASSWVSAAWAQPAPYPPNQFRPYRGGKNCVQVADALGNFNCSPLVTIDPTTGLLSVRGASSIVNQVLGSLVVAPSPMQTSLVSLGNDVVLVSQSLTSVAPTGPGPGALTVRVRPSPTTPGYCRVVVIAGSAFGANQEFPVAFINPALPFGPPVVDLPGGPLGC